MDNNAVCVCPDGQIENEQGICVQVIETDPCLEVACPMGRMGYQRLIQLLENN